MTAVIPGSRPAKSNAKAFLKPMWSQSIAALGILCATVIMGICIKELLAGFVSPAVGTAALVLYTVFVTAPLVMGYIGWLWRATFLPDSACTEMFLPFSALHGYARTVGFVLALAVRLFVAYVVVMLPYAIAHMASSPRFYELVGGSMPVWAINIWIFEKFLKVVGIAAFVLLLLRHYLAPVIFVVGGNLTPAESFYLAKEVGNVSLSAFLQLLWGFLGWALLSLLALPALYTFPYFSFSFIFHCRFAISQYTFGIKTKTYSYHPMGREL